MKKTMIFLLILNLISCNVLQKTKFEEPPSIIQKERQIEYITRKFSCNINGKLFNPDWQTLAIEPKNADIMITTKNSKPYILVMGLELKPEYSEQITIGGINFNKIGKYDFRKNNLVAEYFYTKYNTDNKISLSSTDKETFVSGSLNLTKFDTINKRYAGNFSFVLFNPKKSKDTIKISNGKFYLNLQTQYQE